MKCYECIKMASWKKTALGWKIQFGQFFCLNRFWQKTFELIQELGNNVQNGWKPLKHWRTVSAGFSKGTDWWLESVCIITTVREWCPKTSVPKIHLPFSLFLQKPSSSWSFRTHAPPSGPVTLFFWRRKVGTKMVSLKPVRLWCSDCKTDTRKTQPIGPPPCGSFPNDNPTCQDIEPAGEFPDIEVEG